MTSTKVFLCRSSCWSEVEYECVLQGNSLNFFNVTLRIHVFDSVNQYQDVELCIEKSPQKETPNIA
jgi:hypothetical protein